jgi:hypothetical protein
LDEAKNRGRALRRTRSDLPVEPANDSLRGIDKLLRQRFRCISPLVRTTTFSAMRALIFAPTWYRFDCPEELGLSSATGGLMLRKVADIRPTKYANAPF